MTTAPGPYETNGLSIRALWHGAKTDDGLASGQQVWHGRDKSGVGFAVIAVNVPDKSIPLLDVNIPTNGFTDRPRAGGVLGGHAAFSCN